MTPFLMGNKQIILPITIPITEIQVGETTHPMSPLMCMTIAGAGEAYIGGGTILSGATAGTTLTTVGDGVGTDHGDITIGAGPVTMAGATPTVVGDMPVIMAGVDIMATGTGPITTTIIVETTPT